MFEIKIINTEFNVVCIFLFIKKKNKFDLVYHSEHEIINDDAVTFFALEW